jgi:hypothetical protein
MQHNSTALFHEEQRILDNIIVRIAYVVLVLSLLFLFYGSFQQFVLDKPIGNNPATDTELLITDIFAGGIILGVMGLLWMCKLITNINREGIEVKYIPFHRHPRFYIWDSIERADVRQYRPLIEYGGWGLRGIGKNRAFNATGNIGLQLVFKDGKKLLIGTQKPAEIEAVLASLGKMP